MITTVTLNPAIDKTYTLPNLVPGQINRIRSVVNIPGGKGINVARILRQFNKEVLLTGFLGGYGGNFMEDALKDKFSCHFIKTQQETRSNINILAEDGYVTEILEPGPCISAEELSYFLKKYDELLCRSNVVVLAGSIPKGIDENIYAILIEKAKKQHKKVLLDTSGEALVKGIEAKPDFIKPNQKELEFLIGRKLRQTEQIIEAAEQIHQSGIAHVLVSRGEKGFLYIGEGGRYMVQSPKVLAVNTVGCGDSIVAVMAMGLETGEDIKLLLKKAAAVSAANATTIESGHIPCEMLEEFIKETKIKAL